MTVSKTASGSTTQIASLVNPVGAASTGVRLWMSGTNTTTRGTFIDAVAESTSNDHTLRFGTSASSAAPTERMRIDSSGNLLVGKTSATATDLGAQIESDGQIKTTSNGQSALTLNRKTSDGVIAIFQKDGTTVGSIGTAVGNAYYAGTATGITFGSANLYPTNASGTKTNAALDMAQVATASKTSTCQALF